MIAHQSGPETLFLPPQPREVDSVSHEFERSQMKEKEEFLKERNNSTFGF